MSSTNLIALGNLLATAASEMADGGSLSLSDCFCAMHKPVVHGEKSAVGCRGMNLSSFPPLNAAGKGIHGHCGATVWQREVDRKLLKFISDFTVKDDGTVPEVGCGLGFVANFPDHSPREFGAGYCIMPFMAGRARATVARLLPANPLAADAVRVGFALGRKSCKVYDLQKVGDSLFHVVEGKSKGMDPDGGVKFLWKLVSLWEEYGDAARIGAGLQDWLRANGIQQEIDVRDVDIVSSTALTVPGGSAGKMRLKNLALVGDAALKLCATLAAAHLGVSAEDVQAVVAEFQSDRFMAASAVEKGLGDFVSTANGVSIASAKVGGTAVEAIAGALYLASLARCENGVQVVCQFAGMMGLLPDAWVAAFYH